MTRWLAAILLLLTALPAAAHRGHATLSVIEIEAKTGAVTVTHRMAAHDVEPALVAIAPDAQPSLDDPDAVTALIAYVGRRFRIEGVALAFAGQRLAGDSVVLRFTGTLKGRPRSLRIAGSLFGETHPDHSTQVNVRRAGVTRSLQFGPADPPQTVALPGG
ncbi:MAG: hypothetical protein MUE77_02440 [Sandarakinorhabdus sp.]|jgi:hypothetical protein|nr:hypothetical protein [Sandarakinorhabdus sp.]